MSHHASRERWCWVVLLTAFASVLFPFAPALALEAKPPVRVQKPSAAAKPGAAPAQPPAAAAKPGAAPAQPPTAAAKPDAAPAQPPAAASKPNAVPGDEASRQREAEEVKRLTELYLRNQSVFLRKGELMVELNTFYNRNDRQQFVPVTGGLALAQTTRRFVDTTLVARYGLLTDGLEVDLIAPVYRYAEEKDDFGSVQTTTTDTGVGDFGAAVRYQAWYERGLRPSLVVDVHGKSRTGGSGLTGTGTWNAGGGVTLVKSVDPVVFFGRVGYTYTFSSQTRDLGNIVEYQIGMGFSLNDRVSYNMQLTGATIGAGKIEAGGSTPLIFTTSQQEIMNLVFTTTILVTKQLFIEPLVGVGLTDESFTIVGLRVPYRF